MDFFKNNILNLNIIDVYMGVEVFFNIFLLVFLMNDLERLFLGYFVLLIKFQEYLYYWYIFLLSYYILKVVVFMLKRLGWNYVQVV